MECPFLAFVFEQFRLPAGKRLRSLLLDVVKSSAGLRPSLSDSDWSQQAAAAG
jgi:hypothetical protein